MIDIWPEQPEPTRLAPELAPGPGVFVESPWRSIDTDPPPRGVPIDMWWKWWRASDDTFIGKRVADCEWVSGTGWRAPYGGIPPNSRPTHWMEVPDGPVNP